MGGDDIGVVRWSVLVPILGVGPTAGQWPMTIWLETPRPSPERKRAALLPLPLPSGEGRGEGAYTNPLKC